MRVQIADTITILRQVELPDTCTHCGADVVDVQLVHQQQAIQTAELGTGPEEDFEDWSSYDVEGGSLTPLAWQCTNCSAHLVVPGAQTRVAGGSQVLARHTVGSMRRIANDMGAEIEVSP